MQAVRNFIVPLLLSFYSQDQIESEWRDIEAVFKTVFAMVERAQDTALQPLKDRRQDVEEEAKGLKDELQEEINRLEKTISELDSISVFEDHILFLQVGGHFPNFPLLYAGLTRILFFNGLTDAQPCSFSSSLSQSYPSPNDIDSIRDRTEIEFDTSLSFGTMRKNTTKLLEEIQQELEKLTFIGESLFWISSPF